MVTVEKEDDIVFPPLQEISADARYLSVNFSCLLKSNLTLSH